MRPWSAWRRRRHRRLLAVAPTAGLRLRRAFDVIGRQHPPQSAINGMAPSPEHGYWAGGVRRRDLRLATAPYWEVPAVSPVAPAVGMAARRRPSGYCWSDPTAGLFAFHAPFDGADYPEGTPPAGDSAAPSICHPTRPRRPSRCSPADRRRDLLVADDRSGRRGDGAGTAGRSLGLPAHGRVPVPDAGLVLVTGIGSDAWDRLFDGSDPAELHRFIELHAPATTRRRRPGPAVPLGRPRPTCARARQPDHGPPRGRG